MLCKLWNRSLTATHITDSRSDLYWETLSKPRSKKATHGNHVYFFPLTSLHDTLTHTHNSSSSTHTSGYNPNLPYTDAHENTLSHTCRSKTDDRSVSRPQSLPLLLLFLREVECHYKSCCKIEESGQNTTHCILPKHCTDLRKQRRCYIFTQASAECC